MKKLPKSRTAWISEKQKSLSLLLFLDFDGTLAPIVKRPELARLPAEGRKILTALAKQKKVKIIIISGRSLDNVKKKVGLQDLTYVGNHGLEMAGPGIHFLHPEALEAKQRLKTLSHKLKRVLKAYKTIWVEDKTYTLSIHYREAEAADAMRAHEKIRVELADELRSGKAVLTQGKKVWEVRPKIAWHKGAAVKWLRRFFERSEGVKRLSVYIGDDVTDESAFKALESRGLCIKVTQEPRIKSAADFYVKTPAEVRVFLKQLSRVFHDERSQP